ncbi:hypothetical protein RN001_012204 [Aquatica leii]|uniref:Uncharacterized protein n=1 Tax=Aquatica leii TaxID=1421715 RepID=A0AAN7PU32_9COLE|nr:hypothetical protein RN001_012204 [Aquatica leii]
MQQISYTLKTSQCLTLVSYPSWFEHLPAIRFALNTARYETTGCTAAYLTFSRELCTTDDVTNDFRATIISCENLIPQITPYLKELADIWLLPEAHQDSRKKYADQKKRDSKPYNIGDQVWVSKQITSGMDHPLGVYHVSALSPVIGRQGSVGVKELRRQGRPRNETLEDHNQPASSSGRSSRLGRATVTDPPQPVATCPSLSQMTEKKEVAPARGNERIEWRMMTNTFIIRQFSLLGSLYN